MYLLLADVALHGLRACSADPGTFFPFSALVILDIIYSGGYLRHGR